MKKLLIKLGLFVAVLIVVLYVSYSTNNYLIRITAFKLRSDVVTLITGNSTVQYGLNPKLIDNSENIAVESEPLFFSYHKLKEILNDSNNIQNVVIPYSIIDVRANYDSYLTFLDDDAWKKELYTRFCFLQNPMPYSCLKFFNVTDILYAEVFLRNRIFLNIRYLARMRLHDNHNPSYLEHIGQYKKMMPDSIVYYKSYSDDYISNEVDFMFSGIGLELEKNYSSYLDSIADLCGKYDKKLIVINMPNYREFNRRIPEHITKYYYNVIDKLKKLGNVEFFDYSKLIDDHIYFLDKVHLNWLGAEILSQQLDFDIKGLMSS
jgi:hypothetical protein